LRQVRMVLLVRNQGGRWHRSKTCRMLRRN